MCKVEMKTHFKKGRQWSRLTKRIEPETKSIANNGINDEAQANRINDLLQQARTAKWTPPYKLRNLINTW